MEAGCCQGNQIHPHAGSQAVVLSARLTKGLLQTIINQRKVQVTKHPLFTESALNHVHTQHVKQTLATGMLKLLIVRKKVVKLIKCRVALAELHLFKPSYLQHSSFKFVLQAKFHVILYILNGIKEGTLKMVWVHFPPHWTPGSFNGSFPGNTEKLYVCVWRITAVRRAKCWSAKNSATWFNHTRIILISYLFTGRFHIGSDSFPCVIPASCQMEMMQYVTYLSDRDCPTNTVFENLLYFILSNICNHFP